MENKLFFFFHNKVSKKNTPSFYFLFFNHFIASFFKKRFCCNRSVRCNISHNGLFQLVTNSCCNSFSLIVCMNKQAVKITGLIDIPKAYNTSIFNSN